MKKESPIQGTGVKFTVNEKEHCQVEYQVKADVSLIKKAKQDAIKVLAKSISLPGFRKGKAPATLIEKKFASELVDQWKKSLADSAFQLCQTEPKAKALYHDTQISFDLDSISEDKEAEIRFVFETLPTVPKLDTSAIELVKVPGHTVGEASVNATIEDLRQYFVTHQDIEGRGVEPGDMVTINVDILENEPAERALSDARFEVKQEKMALWMFDLIVGMKKGESKEGISRVDKDASEAEKKSMPPKKVKVSLLSVQQANLPELNDTFAEKLGCKTMKEMKTNLTNLLQKQADEKVQDEYRKQINDQVLEHFKFDLPKSMVAKEVQFRIKQLMEDTHQKKRLSAMKADERKKTIGEVEEQGEKAIRLFFISQKIIQEQKIKVSPSGLQINPSSPLEALFAPNPYQSGSVKENAKQQESIAMSKLLLKKAEDFLIENAKFVEKKKSAPAAKKKVAAKTKDSDDTAKAATKKAAPKTTKKAAPKTKKPS
ncbi:trigger factor [Candidatus Aerophobetes bacterium]|uniref:Trigger factor n=1 Tax=Aerophobetes bacterium TaxID=2030807 RepID=A0A2A4X621_UNCAE|nr:MAG: trigger factor [Candidatus Aerophobetes bacterium]